MPDALDGTGTITGVVDFVKIYVPTTGGVPGLPGAIWGGLQGAVIDKPIDQPWVTLTDLGNGDTIVWIGQGDSQGKFTIPNVPAGTYTLTWWDEPQNTILDLVNVTVASGETIDMGVLPLSGWWTEYDGYVYDDANRNGVMDSGEKGLAGYTLTMRRRENSLMDRGSTVVSTDANGYYKFEAAYPMTQWLVEEAYDDLHYTTGITYQADNQPNPTTILGAGVDVSVHPIIGLSGRLDWGKHTYDPLGRNGIDPRNGGIVGTVTYDTTRNELDPRYAAVEDWQPSVPNLVMKLYSAKRVTATCPVAQRLLANGSNAATATCDATGRYQLDPATKAIATDKLLNTYLTETWQRPVGCVARGADGAPLRHGTDEQVLPLDDPSTNADPASWKGCIEAPLMGVQFAAYETDQGTPDANFGATVDGNYGFGDGCFDGVLDATDPSAPVCTGGSFTALPAADYLVQVDLNSQLDALNRPVYNVTREEDINIGNGDEFVPAVPPPACAGALHTVDVAGILPDGPNATVNPTFAFDIGGSPYEGMNKPLCDVKLVTLNNGKSIAPAFNIFTDVPLPGRHWFIIIDDLNFSSNQQSMTYGEKAGMPFVPVGIYDYTDRLVKTVSSDYNGLADVLLPSTNRINCPTPSGVCTNLYRYVGNDPGVPGRLNPDYNPTFRTIAAEFEVMPGSIIPADLAPTQVGVTVQLPGGQNTTPFSCRLDDATPQLYAVDKPYAVRPTGTTLVPFTLTGLGFGTSGQVTLDGVALGTSSWSNTQIVANISSSTAYGPHQLMIRANNGQSTVNGLTFHVVSTANTGSNYNPVIFEVGPGKTYAPAETLPAAANHAIQRALDAPYPNGASSSRPRLVVVYPNVPSANPRQNPRGAYYENLIITRNVKLQGVGPGSPNGATRGSIIDGGAFAGDSPVATDWNTRINAATWSGNQTVYDGAVVSIYVPSNGNGAFPGTYSANTAPSIDGFDLRGGDQAGFPGNINAIGGGPTGQPGGLITQGGAIYANAYARNLQITNNVVQNNGGAYGTIRIGTPDLTGPDANSNNQNVVIAYNRVIANAGTNQAGAIGLFRGSDSYQVVRNDICGNFSAEYGGGVSVVGFSPNGTINNNRIYSNRSYDEGGGIMIAGALPANTTTLSPGSGPVTIYNNLIQSNLANDDGGGLRFLMSGNFPMDVYNNIIVNNISTHEGGGISINDAPNVRVYNNTIMKNLTTATAITSSGNAAPAGLSSSVNSSLLQATLPAGSPTFSNPLLFNNVFWDNRSGTRGGNGVVGLGNLADCSGGCNYWDIGVADSADLLSPTNSVLQTALGTNPSATNSVGADPVVKTPYDVGVTFNAWRNNPAFLGAIMISADLTPNLMGNYHLTNNTSVAYNRGAANKARPAYQGVGNQAAPTTDIDGDGRPAFGAYDAGADEIRAPTANLGITISDNQTSANLGQVATYTITVTNAGPDAVTAATVATSAVARLGSTSWTCPAGCAPASGSGNVATTVSIAVGGSVVINFSGTVNGTTGNATVTATVTAPAGTIDPVAGNNTSTDSDTVVNPIHVGDLNWTRNVPATGTTWSASATITVHDANHALLANAQVSGAWTSASGTGNNGSGGNGGCTTNASGVCTVTRTAIANTRTGVTFTVSNLQLNGRTYQANLNHDPNTGVQASNGTAITVNRTGALTPAALRPAAAQPAASNTTAIVQPARILRTNRRTAIK